MAYYFMASENSFIRESCHDFIGRAVPPRPPRLSLDIRGALGERALPANAKKGCRKFHESPFLMFTHPK